MASLTVHPAHHLQGELLLPGDKSISHRALLLGAIAEGESRIRHCLQSGDLSSTTEALRALGISITGSAADSIVVEGKGSRGLKAPSQSLNAGNSGTTARLLLGLLSGQPFQSTLTGDESLSRRPMRRVTEPLEQMGAVIQGLEGDNDRLPLVIRGRPLHGVSYTMPVPSAQVKSALLLAGLYAQGKTTVVEPISSRDHTERMLTFFGAKLTRNGSEVTVEPEASLQARNLEVPGDISSAAFFLAAAAIVPGSTLTARGVGLNPTRIGLLDLLKEMGADVRITLRRSSEEWEPVGDVTVAYRSLRGLTVNPQMIPRVIDELPLLMVVATQATGTTVIEEAGELKVKETDRNHSMVTGLAALGADIRSEKETIVIEGPTRLRGARVMSFGDHRTAMALAIAGLAAEGPTTIEESQWIDISFPTFPHLLESVRRG